MFSRVWFQFNLRMCPLRFQVSFRFLHLFRLVELRVDIEHMEGSLHNVLSCRKPVAVLSFVGVVGSLGEWCDQDL